MTSGEVTIAMPDGPVLITGATAGLGRATASRLAQAGIPLLLAVRDISRGHQVADEIRQGSPGAGVTVRHADVSDTSSAKGLGESLAEEGLIPRAVVCNAGVQVVKGVQYSVDGYELTMATNVVGHVALLAPLLPHLRAGARIVTLGSETHRGGLKAFGFPRARWTGMDDLLCPDDAADSGSKAGRVRYSTSKLACIALAYELDRRLRERGVRAACFDPGLMPATGLARDYPKAIQALYASLVPVLVRLPGASQVDDAATDLAWLATSTDADRVMGAYVSGRRARPSSQASYADDLGSDVWAASLAAAGLPLDV